MMEMTLTGDELKEMRERLGMDRKAFGSYVANLVHSAKPYPYSRIADYENGVRDIPSKIEVAFLRQEIARLREEITSLKTQPK